MLIERPEVFENFRLLGTTSTENPVGQVEPLLQQSHTKQNSAEIMRLRFDNRLKISMLTFNGW